MKQYKGLTKEQQRKIQIACRTYKQKMEAIVESSERPGSGIKSISLQVGNGPKIIIAGKKKENKK